MNLAYAPVTLENSEEQFRQAIEAAGLTPPDRIVDDGAIHRFSSDGRATHRNGWYVFNTDGIAAGAFGCWKSDVNSTWCSKSANEMTQAESDAHKLRVKAMQEQREADLAKRHQQAATEAAAIWAAAAPATEHPYSSQKQVKPTGLRTIDAAKARAINAGLSPELTGTLLVIPMRNAAGDLKSLQFITTDGTKRPVTGGAMKGMYHSIGRHPEGELCIAEGWATAASINASTGLPVACAFNAGNLLPVALALRSKYPALRLILCADDDSKTPGNPGVKAATDAAKAVGGYVAVPDFGKSRPDGATDFNDLACLSGAEAVKRCIVGAQPVTAEAVQPVGDQWPEPQPLIAKLEPEEYPLDALPDAVRCAVDEVAGFVKAPIPLIAASALSALSLAIQALVDVERAEKLSGPCSVFGLVIADSGERKSTCDGFFTKAIRDYEAREQEAAKPRIKAHKSELDAWESQRSGLREKMKSLARDGKPCGEQIKLLHDLDADEPVPPRVPRLIYGDATPEALTYALAKGWPSGGILSSEAGIVFGGHAMGNDSAMRNMAVLNQLWDGAAKEVDRRSSESFNMRGARLTMSLMVQEPTIRQFFTNTKGLARGTGFMARFLISWPKSTQGTRNFTEAPANWPALATFNDRLNAILNRPAPIDDNGTLSPAMLKLSPDAKRAWVAFHDDIEAELASGGELFDVRDVASKTADNAARLAALFHTFTGNIGPIDLDAMESGACIAAWHLSEARRFLAEIAMPAEIANPMRLESWMLDYCQREHTDKVPTRAIQQFGPSGLRDKKVLEETVKELAELGRARLAMDGKKRLIQINPALLGVSP